MPVIDDISKNYQETNISERGGFSSTTARAALAMKNYCSLNDLFNPWQSKEGLGQFIKTSEKTLKEFLSNGQDDISRKNFFIKNQKFFNKLLPKMKLKEFLKVTKTFQGLLLTS